MFTLAFLIAAFSYTIFLLGIGKLLYVPVIVIAISSFLLGVGIVLWNKKERIRKETLALLHHKKDILSISILSLVTLQLIVDVVGALGPETGFDALWYHLTIPKLFLFHHEVYHIPGGLLYYTDMPKLTEMLYLVGLSFGSSIYPHLIHFVFGLLTLVALYKLGRKFFSRKVSIIAVAIFSSNIIFHWEVTTAYIDVARTFFEVMALWAFIEWDTTNKKKWFYFTAILVGSSIAIKLISFVSVVLFTLLTIWILHNKKEKVSSMIVTIASFIFISLLIPLPYFLFDYVHTGNPFFPLFSSTYPVQTFPWYNPVIFTTTFWNVFTKAADVISPLYIIFLPLLIVCWKKLFPKFSLLYLYTIGSLLLWYFIPQRNEDRFLLSVLPGFSLLVASVFTISFSKVKQAFLYFVVVSVVLFALGYRTITNSRYIPVIVGYESQETFLTNHLNFSFGDFCDTDHYFVTHIKPNETVLLYGFHNLYYVNFPFIDSTWVKKGDRFNYIAVQDGILPKQFNDWKLVYHNRVTHVQLYMKGNKSWQY